jgi:hypothetical protein
VNQQFNGADNMNEDEVAAAPAGEHGQLIQQQQQVQGNWGIGVSQENRPEGTSFKVRVCLQGKARYLGR